MYIGKVKYGDNTWPVGSTLYGTCDTAANTAAKVVTMPNFDTLLEGVTIHVKFTHSNGAHVGNATLNVNNTGAKTIMRYGTTAAGAGASASWNAGAVVSFTYDGTYWLMNDWLDTDTNTTYTLSTGDSNGLIKVTPSSGSAYNVSIKGLGDRAFDSTKYLPLAGGLMTLANSPIKFTENNLALEFRPNHDSYHSRVLYMTVGNEALVFANKYDVTSFIFKCGHELVNGSDWQSTVIGTPSVQIKKQSLYVNTVLNSGVSPTYNFHVTGTSCFTDQISSTLTTGTSPFSITSTTLNTNLNADLLDGKHASDFATSGHNHDNKYLPLSGGILTNNSVHILNINNTGEESVDSGISFSKNNLRKAWVGYQTTQGVYLFNGTRNKYLNYTDNGALLFEGNNVWHAGNDGSGSGLDADLLDGYHFSDLENRYLNVSGDWMNWNAGIYFKGKNGSTSVYSRIGYTTSASGQTMHCVSNSGQQADGALYITSNGSTAKSGTGGIAIDNEGVTVFGAGDAGSNFTGVFRVLNEDNVADGPQFLTTKSSGSYVRPRLSIGLNSINTSYTLYVNGNSSFNGDILCGNISGSGTTNILTFRHLDGQKFSDSDCDLYLLYNLSSYKTFFNGTTYYIQGGQYNGNSASATQLANSRTIWGQSFNGTGNVSGAIFNASCLDFTGVSSSANQGGYIDFHYNGSSTQTSRIIEWTSGVLDIAGTNLTVNGNPVFHANHVLLSNGEEIVDTRGIGIIGCHGMLPASLVSDFASGNAYYNTPTGISPYNWGQVLSFFYDTNNAHFLLYVSDISSNIDMNGRNTGMFYRSGYGSTRRPWRLILDNASILTYYGLMLDQTSTHSILKMAYPKTSNFYNILRYGGANANSSDLLVGSDSKDIHIIGRDVYVDSSFYSNCIFVNNSNGYVGVGTTSPSYKLHVNGACAASSFPNTSDIRLKDVYSDWSPNIEDIAYAPSFLFKWKDGKDKNMHAGTSAQYWLSKAPELVTEANDDIGTLSIQYDVLGTLSSITLAKEILELKKEIKRLQALIAEIKLLQK